MEPDRTFSVAPMMDYTDRHCRYLFRIISKRTLLYTEMITSAAVVHGNYKQLLEFSEEEHPLALQLGGSDPKELAASVKIAELAGYDEINLNLGCPSNRVQSGRFGACLMAEPETVAACLSEMQANTALPVTVKTRLGIDNRDSYAELCEFIQAIITSGCRTVILHARKALLNGLSPKENREIPELRYDMVYRVKKDFPDTEIIINGGFENLQDIKAQFEHVDGVMVGRAAYHNPCMLTNIDNEIFNEKTGNKNPAEILDEYMGYVERELHKGVPLKHLTKHVLGLFHGQPGARRFRRYLSENACRQDADIGVLRQAAKIVMPCS